MPRRSSIVFILAVVRGIGQEPDLPKFEDFRVNEAFKGPPARPILNTPHQRAYRTVIREAAKNGPNFAGHWTIAEAGCGSDCAVFAMVNEVTGETLDKPFPQITFPPMFDYVDTSRLADTHRVDSRLLVLHGCPEGDICASYYLEWTGSDFKVIRKLPAVRRKP
jgi:hypothetical protein